MNNIFLKILEEERQFLTKKITAIEQAISTYQNASASSNNEQQENIYVNINSLLNNDQQGFFSSYSKYNAADSTRNKILFIIKTENRFLHVREIARIMQLLEEGKSLQLAIKKISPALSFLKKIPDTPLTCVTAYGLHFNTFWGYKEWMTEDGTIPTTHMYNVAEITKGKTRVSA